MRSALLVLLALAVVACGSTTTRTVTATVTEPAAGEPTATETGPSEPAPEPPQRQVPNPDGRFNLQCDYVLGDFGDSGDPAQGYRFIAGGRISNTGNIGIITRVKITWEQLGADPITYTREVRIPRG